MRPRNEQPIVKLLLADLEFGPSTANELAEAVRLTVRNIRPYLKLLHADKKIHICGWQQRTGPALPIWKLGTSKDRPRPKTLYTRRIKQT